MKTNITIVFVLLLAFTGFAQKVGTIDSQLILSKMPELKNVQEGLQQYNTSLETQVQPTVTAYQTLLKEYQDNQQGYSEVVRKRMQDSILKSEANLKRIQQNGAKMIQIKNEELMRPLYLKLGDAIKDVVKEHGYTQILTLDGNTFAYVDPNYDITQLVMDKLGIKMEEPAAEDK